MSTSRLVLLHLKALWSRYPGVWTVLLLAIAVAQIVFILLAWDQPDFNSGQLAMLLINIFLFGSIVAESQKFMSGQPAIFLVPHYRSIAPLAHLSLAIGISTVVPIATVFVLLLVGRVSPALWFILSALLALSLLAFTLPLAFKFRSRAYVWGALALCLGFFGQSFTAFVVHPGFLLAGAVFAQWVMFRRLLDDDLQRSLVGTVRLDGIWGIQTISHPADNIRNYNPVLLAARLMPNRVDNSAKLCLSALLLSLGSVKVTYVLSTLILFPIGLVLLHYVRLDSRGLLDSYTAVMLVAVLAASLRSSLILPHQFYSLPFSRETKLRAYVLWQLCRASLACLFFATALGAAHLISTQLNFYPSGFLYSPFRHWIALSLLPLYIMPIVLLTELTLPFLLLCLPNVFIFLRPPIPIIAAPYTGQVLGVLILWLPALILTWRRFKVSPLPLETKGPKWVTV